MTKKERAELQRVLSLLEANLSRSALAALRKILKKQRRPLRVALNFPDVTRESVEE